MIVLAELWIVVFDFCCKSLNSILLDAELKMWKDLFKETLQCNPSATLVPELATGYSRAVRSPDVIHWAGVTRVTFPKAWDPKSHCCTPS